MRDFHNEINMKSKEMNLMVEWRDIISFVTRKKTKITRSYYNAHLRKQLLPACEDPYPSKDFIFAQDGATSHTSNQCQNFLQEHLGKGRHVSKSEWPPNSTDLNVLYYYSWNTEFTVAKEENSPHMESGC